MEDHFGCAVVIMDTTVWSLGFSTFSMGRMGGAACQKEKMTRQGIEPRTFPSHGGCSTAELHGLLIG
jgi:hypothetical protein